MSSPAPPNGGPPRAAERLRDAPKGRRRGLHWATALAVLALSAAAGLLFASQFGPERLRREIEHQIGQAAGTRCQLATLEVRLGLPIEFEGRGLSLWDGALEVDTLTARLSPFSALRGDVRFRQLEAEGVVVRLRGGVDDPSPPWLGGAGESGDGGDAGLDAIAAAVGEALFRLLGARLPADRLRILEGRVDVHWQRFGAPRQIALHGVEAELQRSRLLGTSELSARARLVRGTEPRGSLEVDAERSHRGDLRLAIALDSLDLDLLADWLPPDSPRAGGRLSGALGAEAPAEGEAVALSLELRALDFAWLDGSGDPLWLAPHAELRASADAEPGRIQLRAAQIGSAPLAAELRGSVTRPVGAESELDLDLRVADFDLSEAQALLDALPAVPDDAARAVLRTLEGGRIASLALSGGGSAEQWRGALEGREGSLRRRLHVGATVEDLGIRLAEDDLIEHLGFRLDLRGDHLQVSKARAERRGHPLPILDLEIEGLSALGDAEFSRRVPENEEVLLVGLPLLLSLFERDPEQPSHSEGPRVAVRLEWLAHPAIFWPLRGVEVDVGGREGGLVAEIRRASWAGVPLRGGLDWSKDPAHLVVSLVAGEEGSGSAGAPLAAAAPARPGPSASPPGARDGEPGPWATGTFRIGRLESRVWSHEQLAGRFEAVDSSVRFAGLTGDLLPVGRVRGRGEIDLGDAASLPYRVALVGEDLDADALLAQVGLGEGLVRGRVHLGGEFSNRYEPGAHPLAHLSGRLEVHARDGAVRHDLPAVLALTLASDLLTLDRERDHVRYTTAGASLEAEEGVVRTDALELDGPDVRLFGSGSLDLGHAPHALDADVVVFLFRPVDRALGAIPIVGDILLGNADNLVAAYFELAGPWSAPTASPRPLRSLYTGPMRLVGQLPGALRRGLDSLTGVFRPDSEDEPPPPGSPSATPAPETAP